MSPAPVVSFYRNPIFKSYITLPIVSPITARVKIEPDVINPGSKGVFTAFVKFPKTVAKGYLEDLNAGSVKCNGVPALSGKLHHDTWIFKFNKEAFPGLMKTNKAKMYLEGSFGQKYNYGNMTFEGSDSVRIHKGR